MPHNTSAIVIRRAETAADADQLLRLIERLAEFENLAPPDADARARFLHDGFARDPRRFSSLLATTEGDEGPCGYAVYFDTYSSFLCRPTLYLEDLFVVPERREYGVGRAIMRFLALEAVERGCGRMEWTCLDWNVNAQKFYARLGAEHMAQWYFYRFDQDAMKRFVDAES